MQDNQSTMHAVFIRLIAIIVLLSLYQYWPVAMFGIEMLDQFVYRYKYEEIVGVDLITGGLGMLNIFVWLLGLFTAISLFMLKTYSRWLLLGYFLLGLIPASLTWIPYVSYLIPVVENPYLRTISLELPNLIIVVLAFVLFRGLSFSKQTPQQA